MFYCKCVILFIGGCDAKNHKYSKVKNGVEWKINA